MQGLSGSQDSGQLSTLALTLPDPQDWHLDRLISPPDPARPNLQQVLNQCQHAAQSLSDSISALYFTHSLNANKTLGA